MLFTLHLMIIVFSLTYYLTERTGLFAVFPPSSQEVLFSMPILSAALLFLLLTLISAVKHFSDIRARGWLLVVTVILLISGLLVSYLTRFSGDVVLTEGQTIFSGHNVYVPETLYRGRFSTIPDIGITLNKIIPSFNSDGTAVRSLRGEFTVIKKEEENPEEFVLTSGLPRLIGGSWFGMKGYGYSPRYTLKSKEGTILDSSFMFMKLFPYGSEDNFRLLSPLTYYLRYYPDHNGAEPRLALRIVRNKDIVFNGNVTLAEEIAFENSRISFDEVRKWSKLTVRHDMGAFFYMPGLLFACLYCAGMIVRIRRNSHEQK